MDIPNINLNIVNPPQLNIVFCLTGTDFSGKFLDSFIDTLHYCNQNNIPHNVSRAESAVVYFVRNKVLGGDVLRGKDQIPFNNKLNYSHLMWIDHDIVFSPEQFQILLNHDKDIVSGIYMMSDNIHYATVEKWDEKFFLKNGYFPFLTQKDIEGYKDLMEVDYTGLGFMLIKKGVFEAIKYPWFRPIFYEIGAAYDFSSEDVSFCKLAKEKGFNIYIDPQIRVGHEKRIVL